MKKIFLCALAVMFAFIGMQTYFNHEKKKKIVAMEKQTIALQLEKEEIQKQAEQERVKNIAEAKKSYEADGAKRTDLISKQKSALINLSCDNRSIPGYGRFSISFREGASEVLFGNENAKSAVITQTKIDVPGMMTIDRITGKYVDGAGSWGVCTSLNNRSF